MSKQLTKLMKNRIFFLLAFVFSFATSIVEALDAHVVMVRAVSVPDEWTPFQKTGGWDRAVTIKESEFAKYYEIVIWEGIKAIHLYAFTDYYNEDNNPNRDPYWNNWEYRETFLVEKVENIPDGGTPEENGARSLYLKNAIVGFVETIAEKHPLSEYSFTYNGHGAPGGASFELQISPQHTYDLFRSWKNLIGKNLAFVDMGGPCNKGGFSDLATFCPFTDYYIASDLPNGGYQDDNWTYEKYLATDIDTQWHTIFENSDSMLDALKKRIDLKRQSYLDAINNMTENKIEQANYLYSCPAFNTFSPLYLRQVEESFDPAGDRASIFSSLYYGEDGNSGALPENFNWDLRQSVVASGNQELLEALENVIVYQADNRDFFEWEVNASGLATPNSLFRYGDAIDLDLNNGLPVPGGWPSPYNGITPDSSLGLASNNIGVFNTTDSTIYACLKVFTNGLESSANGISEFDIGLKVVSLSEATVQIIKYIEFNAKNAKNENGDPPSCSGIFETTTGVYTDLIQTDTSVLETTWNLIDPTNLILKLSSYQELTAD